MISHIIVFIGFLTYIITIHARGITTNDGVQISDKNYHQLINFIKLLHSQNDEDQTLDNRLLNDLENKETISQYQNVVDKKMNYKVKQLMKLLQSNYNANEMYKKKIELENGAQPRIFFISNPEVLDEYRNSLKPKIQTSSSSSLERDDMTRSLKEILQEMRRNIPPSDKEEGILGMRREKLKIPKSENNDYSIEKAPWKLDAFKEVPKKNRDLSKVFDADPKGWNKNNISPKRPVGYQISDSKYRYKPKRDFYKGRGDYHSYGRTSIPIIGKKIMYDKRK